MAVVPAIPTASLMAVQDPQTREVLRAMADGIAIRNGDIGSGDNAFLSKADLTRSGYTATAVANALAKAIADGLTQPGAEMQALADALEQSILQSAAWQAMFSRLKLIDSPDSVPGSFAYNLAQEAKLRGVAIGEEVKTRSDADQASYDRVTGVIASVGQALAGIVNETSLRVNKDNALASAINTMWTAFGSNSALIQDGQLAAVNGTGATATKWNQLQAAIADPVTGQPISSAILRQDMDVTSSSVTGLKGKWGVKLDLNGYVSGVALNSGVSTGGKAESALIVVADKFAVGAPGRPDIVPFAIDAQTGLVAIRGDLVVKKSITAGSLAAKTITAASGVIGDLAVNTLQIGMNAVTVPSYISGSGGASGISAGVERYLASVTLYFADSVDMVTIFAWQASAPGDAGNVGVRISVDGATYMNWSDSGTKGGVMSHIATGKARLSAGVHTFSIYLWNGWSSGSWNVQEWSATFLGVMR